MSKPFAPFGFRPAKAIGGDHGNTLVRYRVPNSVTAAIANGAPVRLNGGYVVAVGASGDGTPETLGVALGFMWVDPLTGQPQYRQYIPAGTSSAGVMEGNIDTPMVLVVDDPNAVFHIQADASVTVGDVGLNFNVTAAGGIDTLYNNSRYALDASTRTSANTAMCRLVGIVEEADNAFGDPYPIVAVRLNRPLNTSTSAT